MQRLNRNAKKSEAIIDDYSDYEEELLEVEKRRVTAKSRRKKVESDEEFEIDEEEDVEDDESLEDVEEDSDKESIKDNIKTGKKRKGEKSVNPAADKEKIPKVKKEKKAHNEKKPPKEKKPKKESIPKVKKEKFLLDPNFSLDASYFYQDLKENEWTDITEFLHNYFSSELASISPLYTAEFFKKFPNLHKGSHNITKLRSM